MSDRLPAEVASESDEPSVALEGASKPRILSRSFGLRERAFNLLRDRLNLAKKLKVVNLNRDFCQLD